MNLQTDLHSHLLGILQRALDNGHGSGDQGAKIGKSKHRCQTDVALHHVDLLLESQGAVVVKFKFEECVIATGLKVVLLKPAKPLLTEGLLLNGKGKLADHLLGKQLHSCGTALGSFAQTALKIQLLVIELVLIAIQGYTSFYIVRHGRSSLNLKVCGAVSLNCKGHIGRGNRLVAVDVMRTCG